MFTTSRGGAALTVVGLLGALALSGPAVADPATRPAYSLNVSPTRLIVPPGLLEYETEATIANTGSLPAQVVVRRQGMRSDSQGIVRLTNDAAYSAMDWVTLAPERMTIASGRSIKIRVKVALPDRYEPGDHHLALVFVGRPATAAAGNIKVNGGVAVPLYVTAPGPVDRSVVLAGFTAPKFRPWGPVTFNASIRHTGTVRRDFRADDELLTVRIGRQSVTAPGFTVLRDTDRKVSVTWDRPPLFCVCRATLAIPDLAGGPTQRLSTTTVIFPLHLLAGGLVLILATVLYARHRRRRRRSP